MIVYETIIDNGVQYDHTYSDRAMMIERDGVQYADAVDPLGSGRVYIETDIPIEQDEPFDEATEADYINALRELGVDTDEEENA